ncbi:MAG: HAD-IA family hydrolase [Alphaproteobacteria bacterium]|uniref:phosphoglycolate phosphatase n=1 Tax=Candidatus Nitrobium versatile TaxID=2884831 RepID=A0A953JE57_9BACT|nr:HAD-IA family hydrolase [Candidatus Nitrobium versatile]
MSLRLIIFDLDGTLIDSSPDIADAINYAIDPYGLPPISVEETIGLVGEGVSRLMEKLIEREGIPADKDLLVGRFLEYYSAHLVDKTMVYPGVRETLEQLAVYKKAVISNKRESLSGAILQKLGLAPYLDIVVGSDTTRERKPSPVPVLYVLSHLGVSPEEAVMVGDSNYDIEAGRAAGVRTVAVTYGYRPVSFLKGADFIIDSLSALPDIAGKLSAT